MEDITLDKILEILEITDLDSVIHSSKAEKFKMIAEKFNQKIEDMIFITDTIGDIKEAKSVSLPTIAVTWGVHDRSYFETEPYENVVAIVDTPEHLEDFINASFPA